MQQTKRLGSVMSVYRRNKGESSLDNNFNHILDVISSLKNDLTTLISEKIEYSLKQVEVVKNTTDKTRNDIDKLSKENKEITERCEDLEQKNTEYIAIVTRLQEEIH